MEGSTSGDWGGPQTLHTAFSQEGSGIGYIYNSGLTERHVQQYGAWASAAYKTYVKRTENHQAARVLSKSLKNNH